MRHTIIELSPATDGRGPAPHGPIVFSAPRAVAVLRAWRAWAANRYDDPGSGFALRYIARPTTPGALVLISHRLDSGQLAEIGRHSLRPLRPRSGPLDLDATALPADPPLEVAPLRAVDDWTTEVFLRTGEDVCRSLVLSLRHRAGRFELVAWGRRGSPSVDDDLRRLLDALDPWIAD